MTSKEIRQQFIEYFCKQQGHTFVPSSPVVPMDDPTLLFTNAGMNQFKPIFLGTEKRAYNRAANTQKCIRAGGKHNDLDDVGKDTYHHTFFEMLGNWSFGDYFKRDAIHFAWDLLTNKWGLDKTRLHATVFMGDPAEGLEADTEAADLWRTITDINPEHIHMGRKKDNFWEMGNTGPCGPCSEIHIDLTPDKSGGRLVNAGVARVMEIWNLVFMQFNRGVDGKLTPLPNKHVDTGMGFERICSVIQNAGSNYDTDVFKPLMDAIAELSGQQYGRKLDDIKDIAFRVIADHARMSTFAITDGAIPSNKKRGAVLRSVIRRAVRFGYQVLKLQDPFMYKLVPVVTGQMGEAFPELLRNPQQVADIIKTEETDFLATIDRGLKIFEDAADKARSGNRIIRGEDVFSLHATLGFPADLTVQLALEQGLSADMDEYNKLWSQHVEVSRKGQKQHVQVAVDLSGFSKTDDSLKYHGFSTEARVLGWVMESGDYHSGRLPEDQHAGLIVDRTTFYAEQGGQVGDVGFIQTATGRFEVTSTERKGEHVLHWGQVSEGHVEAGQRGEVHVDLRRSDTMRNHSTTHLLNWALRKVLGDHIDQKGSLVDNDKLRFDFSHPQALTLDETIQVERLVNEKIYSDLPVASNVMPLADAMKISGVRAVFGEKYPDPVRVISIGTTDPCKNCTADHSVEFCGGTHLTSTGQAGFFKIIAEEAVGKGVRRLTGVTGRAAVEYIQKMDAEVRSIQQALSVPIAQAPQRIAALQDEIKQLKKKLASGAGAAADPAAAAGKLLDAATNIGPGKLVVGEIPGATGEQLLHAMDSLKKKAPSHAIMIGSVSDEKVNFLSAVSDDLIKLGLKAGDWIRDTAKVAGGGGGGRPQMAQAGGKDPSKLNEALETARAIAGKTVKA